MLILLDAIITSVGCAGNQSTCQDARIACGCGAPRPPALLPLPGFWPLKEHVEGTRKPCLLGQLP